MMSSSWLSHAELGSRSLTFGGTRRLYRLASAFGPQTLLVNKSNNELSRTKSNARKKCSTGRKSSSFGTFSSSTLLQCQPGGRRLTNCPMIGKRCHRSLSTAPVEDDNEEEASLEATAEVRDNQVILQHRNETFAFHASWLWSNDPAFLHTSSGQRWRSPSSYFEQGGPRSIVSAEIITMLDLQQQEHSIKQLTTPPRSLQPLGGIYGSSDVTEDQQFLRVEWNNHTTSVYDLNWLWRCRYDEVALKRQQHEFRVEAKSSAIHKDSQLQHFDFRKLQKYETDESTSDVLFEILDAVARDGAVLIEQAPPHTESSSETHISADSQDTVGYVGKMLSGGYLSHGQLYGDIFHVQPVPQAINVAYTSEPLPPHQDLAYYDAKPGLQLLHCIEQTSVVGGESVLVDALAAAQTFKSLGNSAAIPTQVRKLMTKMYRILVENEATFLKQRDNVDMVYTRPHIEEDSQGTVTAIHWSPPFMGPLRIPADRVDDYFLAYAILERMLDNSIQKTASLPIPPEVEDWLANYSQENTWQKQLEPGEILIFNNQRLLHGRRGFVQDPRSQEPFDRHLVGCYVEMDDVLNRYRVLRRSQTARRLPRYHRSFGNGSSACP